MRRGSPTGTQTAGEGRAAGGAPLPRLAAVAVALLLSAAGMLRAAEPYVVTAAGKKIAGIAVDAAEDGTIRLTTKEGVLSFPKGTRVVMDEPEAYGKAVRLMESKRYDEAITLLKSIVRTYRSLDWDVKAQRLLPDAYYGARNFIAAVPAYEALFAIDAKTREDARIQQQYMDALLQTKAMDKLTPMLDAAIATGPRETAARAQLVRGDLLLAAGDLENALFDYMRTADYFQDIEGTQAEAREKTARCLEKLGDARAAEYRRK